MNKYRILSVGVLVIVFVLLSGGNALMAQTAKRCVIVECSPQQAKDCCPQGQSAKDCKVETKSADCCPGGVQPANCCPTNSTGSKSSLKTQPSKNSQRLNSTAEKSPTREIVKPAKSGS
ncbi:MAG: hypothetical protein GY839_06785 [candidate division Zixibacteria bacterium]|nr:hypothetical protein [candidate division Zixibacteria bacterium]